MGKLSQGCLTFTALTLALAQGCRKQRSGDLALIGLTSDNREMTYYMSPTTYRRKFGRNINRLSRQINKQLEQRPQSQPGPWKLTRFDIGVSLQVAVGLPFLSVEARPAFRVSYELNGEKSEEGPDNED